MLTRDRKEHERWDVSATMDVRYAVVEHPDLFSSDDPTLFGEIAEALPARSRRLVFVDWRVEGLYGDRIRGYFARHGIDVTVCSIEVSEEAKTTETLFHILRQMDEFKLLRRKEPVIAIGGGVLMDIVGFAADIYRRGVPYIRVPTTLIGLIDAGIGVKTGTNFNGHKNRIGTYHQPIIAYIDHTFLRTVEARHISNGLAEILKIGLIKDASLFDLLEKHGERLLATRFQDVDVSRTVIREAIHGMLEELEPNLWENTLERLVDFGHTFSGALEMKALPHLLHGEAVSIDMALVSVMARGRGLITETDLSRVLQVMRSMGLPVHHPLCEPDILFGALRDTVSHRDGMQRFPIPVGIGKAAFVNDVTYEELSRAAETLKRLAAR